LKKEAHFTSGNCAGPHSIPLPARGKITGL